MKPPANSVQELPCAPGAATTPGTRAWRASLSLTLAPRGDKTRLLRNDHFGPLRVQRPFYPEGERCHVYLLHPPGGLVLGDRLDIQVEAQAGAQVLVTTPSAGKIYNTERASERQQQHVRLSAAPGACLEWLPQETIVFSGANGRLSTRLELQQDARAALWDMVCLGRPAAGERFEQGCCEQILEVWQDGQPLLIERNRFRAGEALLQARWGLQSAPVSGTFLATVQPSRDQVDAMLEALADMTPGDAHNWGITQKNGLLLARYLGNSTRIGRLGFEYLWRQLRPALTGTAPVTPRIWLT